MFGRVSGSGLVVIFMVLLLAVVFGLYLRKGSVEDERPHRDPAPQASVRVIEGNGSLTDLSNPRPPLPADQMELIKQVFAPELLQ
jgi:hypothetical protein